MSLQGLMASARARVNLRMSAQIGPHPQESEAPADERPFVWMQVISQGPCQTQYSLLTDLDASTKCLCLACALM